MGSKTPATHVAPNRETLFRFLLSQASAAGYSGSLVWAVAEDTDGGGWLPGNDGPDYVFRYSEDGAVSLRAEYDRARTANVVSGAANISSSSPPATPGPTAPTTPAPSPPPPPPPACPDVPPPGPPYYSCAQQVGWGKCNETWMQGYCKASCGKCPSSSPSPPATPAPTAPTTPAPTPRPTTPAPTPRQTTPSPTAPPVTTKPAPTPSPPSPPACPDVPPPGPPYYSCAQQVGWGKCGETWMRGYCKRSCGKC